MKHFSRTINAVLLLSFSFNCVNCKLFADTVLFPRLPNVLENIENSTCLRDSELFVKHLNNFTLWAQEMWDASVKYPSGVLRGNRFQLGDMEECLALNGPFETQFCLITLTINVPKSDRFYNRDPFAIDFDPNEIALPKLQETYDISQFSRRNLIMGLCLPDSCTGKQLENFYNIYVSTLDNPLVKEYNVSYNVAIPSIMCQNQKDMEVPFDTADILFCALTVIIFILVLTATLYEYYEIKKKPIGKDFLLAFSAIKNCQELNKFEDDGPLKILYGIKVISIFLIIFCHRAAIFIMGPIINFDYIEHGFRSMIYWIVYRGDMSVDTFFFASGMLAMFNILKHLEKKSVSPFMLLVTRYVRLTPVYAYVIFYYCTLFFRSASGPLWKAAAGAERDDCRENWWTNLLYINNYVNDDHICMIHSWYLPNDFHFFVLCLAIAIVIKKSKKFGLSLLAATFILSFCVPFLIVLVYKKAAFLQFYPDFLTAAKVNSTFKMVYTKSHMRATPYVMGMFTGYIYYKIKDSKSKLSKSKSHAITAISFIFLGMSIVGGFPFYNRYREYNAIESGAYASLNRISWAVGIAGLISTVSYGHASVLRSILTWSPFVPLSKLGYALYLVHVHFQIRSSAMRTTPAYYDFFNILCYSCGDTVISLIVAFFLYVGIEAPLKKIFNLALFPRKTHAAENNDTTLSDNKPSETNM